METETMLAELIGTRYERDGWAVAMMEAEDGSRLTAVGQLGVVRRGARYELEGRWEDDPRWGRQLRIAAARLAMPADAGALEAYLATVPGIGPVTAARLAIACPADADPLAWLEGAPAVAGVRAEQVASAAEQLRGDAADGRAQLELRALLRGLEGFGPRRIAAILERWHGAAADVVRADPYCLRQVDGVGWLLADRVARERLGFAPADPRRLAAGVTAGLEVLEGEGHAGAPPAEVEHAARELLGVLDPLPLADGRVVTAYDGLLYRPRLAACEAILARGLAAKAREAGSSLDAEAHLDGLDADQALAVVRLAGAPLGLLTGGPGTGKTTTIRRILDVLDAAGERAVLAAPTGKAARRMIEQTGRAAKTLHALMRIAPGDDADPEEDAPAEDELAAADLVVVDEASMLDLSLAARLVRRLQPGQRLLLVGDLQQLPSVGPGAVLRDVAAAGVAVHVRLGIVHRQAGGRLLDLVHAIGRGDEAALRELLVDPPEAERAGADLRVCHGPVGPGTEECLPGWILQLCAPPTGRLAAVGYAEDDWQVVSPTNEVTPVGCGPLNAKLQRALRGEAPTARELAAAGWRREEPPPFRLHDRVVQTKNEDLPAADAGGAPARVVNGEQVTVVELDLVRERLVVDFAGSPRRLVSLRAHRLQLAYAVTAHKAQGSEWPCVVLPVHRALPARMMTREWVYTAASRARRLLVVVGETEALIAAARRPAPPRHGRLVARLAREMRRP